MHKVGDRVSFKQDIEGIGYIREIERRRTFEGTRYTYILGATERPEDGDCYPWHRMAREMTGYNELVIVADERDLF